MIKKMKKLQALLIIITFFLPTACSSVHQTVCSWEKDRSYVGPDMADKLERLGNDLFRVAGMIATAPACVASSSVGVPQEHAYQLKKEERLQKIVTDDLDDNEKNVRRQQEVNEVNGIVDNIPEFCFENAARMQDFERRAICQKAIDQMISIH